jgi:hypothetical protein
MRQGLCYANSWSNKRLIFWKSLGSSHYFLFVQVWHVCASKVIEFVVFWSMLHSILNPVFVDLTSKEKIMVTSYTVISHSSPRKFLMECTIRVIQLMLTFTLWLPRVPRFGVLQLFLGHCKTVSVKNSYSSKNWKKVLEQNVPIVTHRCIVCDRGPLWS